jgi:hypothetical protein
MSAAYVTAQGGVIHLIADSPRLYDATLPFARTFCGRTVQPAWLMGDETVLGSSVSCRSCRRAFRPVSERASR